MPVYPGALRFADHPPETQTNHSRSFCIQGLIKGLVVPLTAKLSRETL
jgi:hypothetical protein